MGKKRRKAIAPPVVEPPRRPMTFSAEAAALLSRKAADKRQDVREAMFAPAVHPPAATPNVTMAMDDALIAPGAWAVDQFGSFGGYDGLPIAMPMTVLAVMAQRAEYFKIADVPAREMTRRWIKITSVDQKEDKSDRIRTLEEAMTHFRVRDAFRDAIRRDGLMGRGHIFIDLDEADASTPIGNGRDKASKQKIRKGGLKGIRSIDPLWIYPQGYNATNPLAPDWYKPQTWRVMGQQVHASRLQTIVAREVPDILKSAYSFGGLSLTQIAEPYVQNWLRARQSVSDIMHAFSVFVLKTNMQTGLMGGAGTGDGAGLDARLTLFNLMRDNRGILALDKDAEEFANVSAQLGTLDKLQAQAQEQMSSVASIPLVKLLGITPSGLNATSDGEIRVFYDDIHAAQEDHLRDPLQTILDVLQLHCFGDVDDSIRFNFEPLWSMSERERAEVEKLEAETDQVRVDSGVLAPIEVRMQVAVDPETRYGGLDVDDVPDLSAEEAEGLEPKGETAEDAVEGLFGPRQGA